MGYKLKELRIIGDIDYDFMKNNKKWKCLICNYETERKSWLKTHFRIHTGSKPFKCTQCDFRFSVSSTLKTHTNTYWGKHVSM